MTLTQDITTKFLELPNRIAGTAQEQKAGEYLKSVYNYLGVQTKETPSTTIKDSLNNHLIISFSLILLTILVNFLNITVLTLAFFAASIITYLRFFNFPLKFFKNKSQSKNIYAEIPAKSQEKYTLVLTSHYDTGNDYGPLVSLIGTLYSYLNSSNPNVPQYINNPLFFSNISVLLTLLALFLPDNYAKFFFGIIAAIPLVIGIYFMQKSKKKFYSGAYNNAVGTSLMLEMASNFTKNPLDNVRLIFANVAATETLTKGTIPFLNSLNLDKLKTFVLDVNCIGEDEIVLMHSEPSYPIGISVPFDSSFEVIADFAQQFLGTDFKILNSPVPSVNQDLILNRYRVMGILATMPKAGYPTAYHNAKDTVDKIKWDRVELVRDFLTAYLDYFDQVAKEVIL